MRCPTCREGLLLKASESGACVVRTYTCRCGHYLTLEILEDQWKTLLRMVGNTYGALKGLREEECDG